MRANKKAAPAGAALDGKARVALDQNTEMLLSALLVPTLVMPVTP